MIPINTPDGLFHDGNPATNTPGTIITAEWLNAVQADLLALAGTVKTVTATYPVNNNDGIIFADTSGAGFTVTLPVVAGLVPGKRFFFKNLGDNTMTLVAADGKTIDGVLEVELQLRGEKITVCLTDGGKWESI